MKISEWRLKISDNVTSAMSKISGAADAASARFGRLQEKIEHTSSGFGHLKSLIIGAVAGISLGAFMHESLSLFDQQDKANALLQQHLVTTGGVAGKTFEDLRKASEKMSEKTLFPDEEVSGAQALLLTFDKVRGKIYDETIPIVGDLATAFNMDLASATKLVGRALQDPTHGLMLLRRSGVAFTEQQTEMIKKMVEGGNLAGAQTMILGALQEKVGGSAEAVARAGMGPLTLLQHRWEENLKVVGKFIAEGMNWLIDNGGFVIDVLKGVAAGAAVIAVAYGILNAETIALTIVTWALNLAWLANPISWVIIGIAAFVGWIVYAYDRVAWFRGLILGLWDVFKAVFSPIWEMTKAFFNFMGDKIVTFVQFVAGPLKAFGSMVMDFLLAPIKLAFTLISKIPGLGDKFKGLVESFKTSSVGEGISGLADKFNAGYKEGSSEVNKKLATETKEKAEAKKPFASVFKPSMAGEPGAASENKAMKKGMKNISEGGKQSRNITVNIAKMIEALNINTTNLKEGATDIKRQVEEIILRAVNGAELGMRNE